MDRYRRAFRQKVIPRYYRGSLHVASFVGIQSGAVILVGSKVHWNWEAVLIVGLSLAYATTFTYFLHRFLLHRKVPGLGWAHKMHHWHHTFYQSNSMEYEELDDVYMLLMPPWIQILYYLLYLPALALVAGLVFGSEVTLPIVFGLTLWYGIYELVHWMEHLPSGTGPLRFRPFQRLRAHHAIHHSSLKDKANFGIVEPSWDYILGTKK